MIKLEHVVLPSPEQMEFVIEGIRNPMNSWDKSDSGFKRNSDYANGNACNKYLVGGNDLALMRRLANAGTDHRKFMRMMPVMVRITAPLYWWKEFDTYKVGTVANSCSTMHKITEKEFTWDDFSWEHMIRVRDSHLGDLCPTLAFETTIKTLNYWREKYLECEKALRSNSFYGLNPEEQLNNIKQKQKQYWYQLIQLLPSSYNQTRNVMLNYEVLANIYHSRKTHKLDEWVEFCKWIKELPCADIIMGYDSSLQKGGDK